MWTAPLSFSNRCPVRSCPRSPASSGCQQRCRSRPHYALRGATELCRRRGLRPFLGQIHYHRALMLLARRASGDHRRALELLNEADAVFGELGLHYLREKVRAVLAAPRRGRPGSEGPRGLTARETSAGALLAEGKSNREIAAHLFVSERTVARHLENI